MSMEESSLAMNPEGRLIPSGDIGLRDSLENVAHSHDKDSLLEGGTSQEMFTSQDTHGISGDTFHVCSQFMPTVIILNYIIGWWCWFTKWRNDFCKWISYYSYYIRN